MQACNSLKRIVFTAICLTSFSVYVYSQSEMPGMPDMPEMPSISQPQIGEPFYVPTIPRKKVQDENVKNDGNSKSSDENKNTYILKDATTTDDILNQLIYGDNLLTANDISTLYDSGMFNNISSLTGTNLSNYSSSSTNLLLQKVLSSLEEMKTEQQKSSPAEKEKLSMQQQDNKTFRQRNPSVLRFKINGYNISDSLTETFFSEPEADGSFLFTADRKYFVNQNSRTETFYFLFKTSKSNGASTTFDVIPTIAQDKKNINSYVYKMCQKNNITAEKTGNLVIIHYQDGDFSVDMLLDIDK